MGSPVSYLAPACGTVPAPPAWVGEAGAAPAKPRLLDRVRSALSLRHYSRRTEDAYVGWIRRYVLLHGKRHPPTVLEGPDDTLRTIPSDSTIGEIVAANVGPHAYRRDYRRIVVPALFIFAASWLPTHLPDEAARRADIWTREEYRPVRESTIARLRAELPAAEIIELPSGSHLDFVFVHRGEIVKSLREFAVRRRDGRT